MNPWRQLEDIWSQGVPGDVDGAFILVQPVGGAFAGFSPTLDPALVVPLAEPTKLPPNRALGGVKLTFHRELEFKVDERVWRQSAAAITCAARPASRTFSVFAASVAERLEQSGYSPSGILAVLDEWRQLLTGGRRLEASAELGLWGELELIVSSGYAGAMARCWLGPSRAPSDFFGHGIALECKTTRTRGHHRFSHRQLEHPPEDGARRLVASLWVEEDATSGRSLPEQIERTLSVVDDQAGLLREILRVGYREEDAGHYQTRFALRADPRLLTADDIPLVRSYDDGVSNITYDVDTSRLPSLDAEGIARLFAEMTRDGDD